MVGPRARLLGGCGWQTRWGWGGWGGTAEERWSQGREHQVWSGELVHPCPPSPSKHLCRGQADGFFWHSRSQPQWVTLCMQGPAQSCRSRPLSGEPWKAGRTAECSQVLVMAGALCRESARPHACLKCHLLRLGGRVPVCERGRGTAASRPRCWWWPQPGGPHGGRGCVRGHGWPTHRNCPPGPAHQTIAPPVIFRAGLSCLQIFGSRPQKIPSVSFGSELLPWLTRVTRAGCGGAGLRVPCPCCPPRTPLLLLLAVSLWFSGASPSILTGPQWTALACRRLRFSWTQLRPGTGLPAGDCDAPSPLCLQSHPRVSHAAGAFSGGSFVTASPASARGWLPAPAPRVLGVFLHWLRSALLPAGLVWRLHLARGGRGGTMRSSGPQPLPWGLCSRPPAGQLWGRARKHPPAACGGLQAPSQRDRVAAAWVPGPSSEVGGGAGGVCAAGWGLWSPCWPGWGWRSEPASR